MFDAEIGLDRGDSITLRLDGGSIFVWNNNGSVSVSVNRDGLDILQLYVNDTTLDIKAVTSPLDKIKIPVKSWQETLRMEADQ